MKQLKSRSATETKKERPLRTQVINLIFLIQHLIASYSQSQDNSVQEYLNSLNNQLETILRNFYPQGDFFGEMAERVLWNRLKDGGALRYYAEYEKKLTGLSKRMLSAKQQFHNMCGTIQYDPDTGHGSWAQLEQVWEQVRTHTVTDTAGKKHKVSNEKGWAKDMFRKYKSEYIREYSKQPQEQFDIAAKNIAGEITIDEIKTELLEMEGANYDFNKTELKSLENKFNNPDHIKEFLLRVYVYRELNPLRFELRNIFNTGFLGTLDELKAKLSIESKAIPDDDIRVILSEMRAKNEIDKGKRQNEEVYHKHQSKKDKPSSLNPLE